MASQPPAQQSTAAAAASRQRAVLDKRFWQSSLLPLGSSSSSSHHRNYLCSGDYSNSSSSAPEDNDDNDDNAASDDEECGNGLFLVPYSNNKIKRNRRCQKSSSSSNSNNHNHGSNNNVSIWEQNVPPPPAWVGPVLLGLIVAMVTLWMIWPAQAVPLVVVANTMKQPTSTSTITSGRSGDGSTASTTTQIPMSPRRNIYAAPAAAPVQASPFTASPPTRSYMYNPGDLTWQMVGTDYRAFLHFVDYDNDSSLSGSSASSNTPQFERTISSSLPSQARVATVALTRDGQYVDQQAAPNYWQPVLEPGEAPRGVPTNAPRPTLSHYLGIIQPSSSTQEEASQENNIPRATATTRHRHNTNIDLPPPQKTLLTSNDDAGEDGSSLGDWATDL